MIFSRPSIDTERMSDSVSGTKMPLQSTQMRQRHATTRVTAGFPGGTVEVFPASSIPGMMFELLTTIRQKFKAKSSESAENDDLWQITCDDGSFMNGKNNKNMVLRSYQLIRKKAISEYHRFQGRIYIFNGLGRSDLNIRGIFPLMMLSSMKFDDNNHSKSRKL